MTDLLLIVFALFGHAVVWVGVNNRLHAMPIKRPILKAISALWHLGMFSVVLVFVWWLRGERVRSGEWQLVVERAPIAFFYILFCLGIAVVHLPRWLFLRFVKLHSAAMHGRRLFVMDAVERLGLHPTRGVQFALGKLVPWNQVMQVEFTEKSVRLPELSSALNGLRIVHLSDLHLSGRVDPDFFREVVKEVNSLRPDLVLLTGDICDKASCLAWLPEVLGPVRARYGKFFILGNHDDRLADVRELRAAICATGFVDVGGRPLSLTLEDETILLAGNERPWFKPVSDEDLSREVVNHAGLKVLLSHSPDQVRWARRRGFDLMLSGHTHGGQIQFPFIGPVVCPSWFGVRYAAGLFSENGLTLHVSRGVSGLFPIRWNCLPEVAVLVLHHSDAN